MTFREKEAFFGTLGSVLTWRRGKRAPCLGRTRALAAERGRKKTAAATAVLFVQKAHFSVRKATTSFSFMRTCSMVSLSRTVTVPSSSVWKSQVRQKGVPISS